MSWPAMKLGVDPANLREYFEGLPQGQWHPSLVVLHNTAEPTFADWHKVDGKTRMLNLEHYYKDQLGWSGGPHLFVADDYVWVFNDIRQPGIHSPSWNHISWGVEIVGDYSHESLNPQVHQNLITVVQILLSREKLTAEAIRMHHEDPLTTHKGCPGVNISKATIVSDLRSV